MDRRQFSTALAALGLTSAARAKGPVHAETIPLSRNGWMPNNDRLPVLLYRGAFQAESHIADTMEHAFTTDQWPPQWRNGVYSSCLLCALLVLSATPWAHTQAAAHPEPTKSTSLSFDLAAIHENKPNSGVGDDESESNVPLGPGNVYSPTSGVFNAKNIPLIRFIAFAFKMTDSQLASFKATVPDWVNSDDFSIQARTEKTDVTKDELRLMMRSLLRDRFGLAVHNEIQQVSVYAITLVKPPQTGPRLQPHPSGSSCPTVVPGRDPGTTARHPETVTGGLPYTCGGIVLLPSSVANRVAIGARNIPMSLLVNSLMSWGQLSHPLVDRTGLTGNVDFVLEYVPDAGTASAAIQSLSDADTDGPSFRTALKVQLGLKLDAEKGSVDVIVLDHIDHLSAN